MTDDSPYDELLHAYLWVLAVEMGEIPIWEVLWELRGDMEGWLRQSGISASPDVAAQVVRDLATRGWIEFQRLGPMHETRDGVPVEEVERILTTPDWHDPERVSFAVALVCTPSGVAEYERWSAERREAGLWASLPPTIR